MPGSAQPMLSSLDAAEANNFVKELAELDLRLNGAGIGISGLIGEHMLQLGAEVNYHNVHPQLNTFHPLRFFSGSDSGIIQKNYSCSIHGTSVVGIIRAPRGDGKEAIVLVTPFNSQNISQADALSLGIVSSIFSLLTRVTWLAKDIIWLAADSKHGEYASVSTWLREYHAPLFSNVAKPNAELCHKSSTELMISPDTEPKVTDSFRRAGTMAAALVIKVADKNKEYDRDTLSICAEASNGQMPNLDLINIVNYLAVHSQGLRVKVDKIWSLLDWEWLEVLGRTFESLGNFVRSLNPQWKFGIPAGDYIDGTATLASSLYNQALGVPTGPHGAFRDYQVDAITLEISPKYALYNKGRRNEFLLRSGRLVESVLRSVNNLLEKFHQSFFLYILTAPSKFVSVGVYMIAFALLIAPLPMVAASLYSNAYNQETKFDKKTPTSSASADTYLVSFKSWRWLHAVKEVFLVHLWSVIVTLLPYFITQIPNLTPTNSLVIWVAVSFFTLFTLRMILGSSISLIRVSPPQSDEWLLLKSVTISAAFIGLSLMSVINFATAEIGALFIVPICLVATPFRYDFKARSLRSMVRVISNMALIFIGFPPTAYVLLRSIFEGFAPLHVGDFWSWVESLWAWNSATYLYVSMVHLPCWVLCVYILLHRC